MCCRVLRAGRPRAAVTGRGGETQKLLLHRMRALLEKKEKKSRAFSTIGHESGRRLPRKSSPHPFSLLLLLLLLLFFTRRAGGISQPACRRPCRSPFVAPERGEGGGIFFTPVSFTPFSSRPLFLTLPWEHGLPGRISDAIKATFLCTYDGRNNPLATFIMCLVCGNIVSFPFFCGASLLRFLYLHCALRRVADLRVPHVIWRPPKNTLQYTALHMSQKTFGHELQLQKQWAKDSSVVSTTQCLHRALYFSPPPPPPSHDDTFASTETSWIPGNTKERSEKVRRLSAYSSYLSLGSALCIPLTFPPPPPPPSDFR